MQKIINFGIELPSNCFTYMENISFYDNSYYKIKKYGDWFDGDLDILYQRYNECENSYSYELGKMIDGEFKCFVCWTTQEDMFEND